MTQSGRMFPAGIRGLARALASGLLVLAASGLAAAEGEPPRLPQISDTPMVVDIPAAPKNVDAVLVERMAVDGVSPARFSSQDFVVNQDDSQGADDFCIPAGDASWVVTNVDVVGAYNVASGYSTSSVNVYFMAHNAGHVPGTQLYFANVAPAGRRQRVDRLVSNDARRAGAPGRQYLLLAIGAGGAAGWV